MNQRPANRPYVLEELPNIIRNNSSWVADCGCWIWEKSLCDGYGQLMALGERYAHRISFIVFRGPIPKELQVQHICNVRCCVNPDHLLLGTVKQNSAYMMQCGRQIFQVHPEKHPRGDKHWRRRGRK
jgi:hypothetical protein